MAKSTVNQRAVEPEQHHEIRHPGKCPETGVEGYLEGEVPRRTLPTEGSADRHLRDFAEVVPAHDCHAGMGRSVRGNATRRLEEHVVPPAAGCERGADLGDDGNPRGERRRKQVHPVAKAVSRVIHEYHLGTRGVARQDWLLRDLL